MNRTFFVCTVSLLFLFFIDPIIAETSRFKKALPGYRFAFPRDHGSHNDMLIEWWYFTGQLSSESGDDFGYELTFFRRGIEAQSEPANPSRWAVHDIYLAHFAITDISAQTFFSSEKMSRAALGKAGAKEDKMHVWIDNWSATQTEDVINIKAEAEEWRIDLQLQPQKELVIHGEDGISKKGNQVGDASHYYSYTRLRTRGRLSKAGQEEAVSGFSWMDHEFASGLLGETQVGWDWFSIQLDDGSEVMLYQIREKNGNKDPVSSGTLIHADGSSQHLHSADFSLKERSYWKSETSGATYPVEWEIEVPSAGLILRSKPLMLEQELLTSKSTKVTYWEGASTFEGHKKEQKIKGRGYIELTGYAK